MRRAVLVRLLAAAVALTAVIAAVPALPAAWATLAAPGAVVGDGAAAGGGAVTVTRCSRSFPLAGWQCRGSFAYADPMAQGSRVFTDVVLANDPRHHVRGEVVSASLQPGTHRAYLWGASYAGEEFALLLGVALCALLAGGLLLTLRRRSAPRPE